jgi:hypothetical protein
MTVGIGDTVLRAENRESMPNAFGGADIFGRTRPTGFSTVQYGGMQGNKVVLLRNSVVTQSEATTMNSTGQFVSNGQNSFYIPPAGASQTSVAQGTPPIIVDYKTVPSVPMMGHVIFIEAATPTSLTYHIE